MGSGGPVCWPQQIERVEDMERSMAISKLE